MHSYHDDKGALPPAAVLGQDGQPLLSWRVLLLPYIDQQSLYMEFKLDEPWDSPHNSKLIERMPPSYEPYRGCKMPPHTTFFKVIRGPGTPFDRPGLRLKDLKGGTSNTFLIIEAAEPVVWTKPDDLDYHPEEPLPRFGGILRDGTFRVLMADGSVWQKEVADEEAIRVGITGVEP
jgi:hypothetical protein